MEKIEYALQILLLGFSVVIFTLFFLYGVISVFNRIFYHPAEKKTAELVSTPQHPVEFEPSSSELHPRVVAAITAAVFRYLQQLQETSLSKVIITVKPYKANARKSWVAAGRKNLLENRLEHERLRRKGHYEKV